MMYPTWIKNLTKRQKYMNTSKAGANATLVEREKLIYPLASLVREALH